MDHQTTPARVLASPLALQNLDRHLGLELLEMITTDLAQGFSAPFALL